MKKQIFILALSIPLLAASVSAQWLDKGPLNRWSSLPVSRILVYEDFIYLTDVRAARNDGFDRLVFEFKGGLPRYRVAYATALERTDDVDGKPVKMNGKHVVSINLQSLPYPDTDDYKDPALPTRSPDMRSFVEIKETEWFEGVRFFLVGLEAKRPFRVQELSNPYRLVIDFRH
jgi:hypothetical protein